MSSASHRQSLSAFEDDDPIVSGLQSKIANFQKKQKEKSKLKNDYFDWIRAGNDLNEAESATTKQILHACSNVLELMCRSFKSRLVISPAKIRISYLAYLK